MYGWSLGTLFFGTMNFELLSRREYARVSLKFSRSPRRGVRAILLGVLQDTVIPTVTVLDRMPVPWKSDHAFRSYYLGSLPQPSQHGSAIGLEARRITDETTRLATELGLEPTSHVAADRRLAWRAVLPGLSEIVDEGEVAVAPASALCDVSSNPLPASSPRD